MRAPFAPWMWAWQRLCLTLTTVMSLPDLDWSQVPGLITHWLQSIELYVADGNDLVAALPPGGAYLDGIALALAYQSPGDR